MSCDGRFRAFCAALGGSGGPLASVFPDPQDALHTIQDVARARAPIPPPQLADTATASERIASLRAQLEDAQAQSDTLELFRLMRDVYQLEPPAHGDPQSDGLCLPQRDACYGYQAIWQTAQATMTKQPLPAVAKDVQAAQQAAAARQRAVAVLPLAQQLSAQHPMLTTLCRPDAMEHVHQRLFQMDPEVDRTLQQAVRSLETLGGQLPASFREAIDSYNRRVQFEAARSITDAVVPSNDLYVRQELAVAIRRAAGTPSCGACGAMLTAGDGAHVCQVRAWASRMPLSQDDYRRSASRLGDAVTTPTAIREAARNVLWRCTPETMEQFDQVLTAAAVHAAPDTSGIPAGLPPGAARYARNHEADMREMAAGKSTPQRLANLRSFVSALKQDRRDGFSIDDELLAVATRYRDSADETDVLDATVGQQLAARIYPPAISDALPHSFATANDAAAWANTTALLGSTSGNPWRTWDDHPGDPEELVIICAESQDATNLAGLSTYYLKGPLGLRGECSEGEVLDTNAGQGHIARVRFDLTKSPSDDADHRISEEFETFLTSGSPVRTTNRSGPTTRGTRAVNGIHGDFWVIWR